MNRRQKIIISVTGIFIVLLILLGLTYGYFLTRITGNGNPTSISVTTANLELVYGDGTTAILTSSNPLMPSSTPIGTKDFTVTNNGDDSEYVVVFEDVTVKYAADTVINGQAVTAGTDTTFESNDFVYTLTCIVKDKNGNTLSDKSCDGVENETFPMDGGIVIGNSIDKDDVHNYVLTMYYLDNGLDQSVDMNKALNGKINIKDIKSINPYSENTSSLAYNIINNSMLAKNGTELKATPDTKVAEEISLVEYKYISEIRYETVTTSSLCAGLESWAIGETADEARNAEYGLLNSYEEAVGKYIYDYACGIGSSLSNEGVFLESYNPTTTELTVRIESEPVITEEIDASERTLSIATDDYGMSYYYRGNVQDNYVTFADMCWRIVRIVGDGNIKLILEDQDQPCGENINGNWAIPTTTGGTTYTGNFGYTFYQGNTLTASDGTKNSSATYVMDYLHPQTNSANSMATVFKNFQSTFTVPELSKLKSGNWCLADNAYDVYNNLINPTQIMDNIIKRNDLYYDSYLRLSRYRNNGVYKPTLKCNGTLMNNWEDNEQNPTLMYVSAITADEVVYAGGTDFENNQNYYLINQEFQKNASGLNKSERFWTLSPTSQGSGPMEPISYAYTVTSNGLLEDYFGNIDYYDDWENEIHTIAFRPAINLKAGIEISGGVGTLEKPYIISD